jgi:hypothetical protein
LLLWLRHDMMLEDLLKRRRLLIKRRRCLLYLPLGRLLLLLLLRLYIYHSRLRLPLPPCLGRGVQYPLLLQLLLLQLMLLKLMELLRRKQHLMPLKIHELYLLLLLLLLLALRRQGRQRLLAGIPASLGGKHDFAANDFTIGGLVAGGGDVEIPGALLVLFGNAAHAWIEGMAGGATRGAVKSGLELLHLELVLLLNGLETRRS